MFTFSKLRDLLSSTLVTSALFHCIPAAAALNVPPRHYCNSAVVQGTVQRVSTGMHHPHNASIQINDVEYYNNPGLDEHAGKALLSMEMIAYALGSPVRIQCSNGYVVSITVM